jgi:hypothetical protein
LSEYISFKYREEEGRLLMTSEPDMDFSWKTFIVEYKVDEKKERYSYQGLKSFITERANRGNHYGVGVDIYYLPERLQT